MDSYEENQIEDGFDQIEDEKESVQKAEKLKGSPADEGTVDNPAASTIRICDFCGKTYNNGKALGGHRRHHLQSQRKEAAALKSQQKVKIRLPSPKSYKNSSSINDVDEDNNCIKVEALMSNGGKTTCDLCNKEFPSMKSYYGHMRTHPERDRRGLRSPNSKDDSKEHKETSFVTSRTVIAPYDESPMDLSKSLPSWSKTDSRGRKSIGGAEAAQNLVYLSRAEYFSTPKSLIISGMSPNISTQTTSTDDEIEAKSSAHGIVLQCKDEMVDDCPSREQKVVRKSKFHRRSSLIGGKDEDKEEESSNWGEEECEKNDMNYDDSHLEERKMVKKTKKISKLMSPQSSESKENPLIKTLKMQHHEYKCNICGKSFATFQALGGHTSSHSKGKKITIRTMNDPGDNNGAGFIPQVMNETKGSESRGLVVEEPDTAQGLSFRRSSPERPLSEEAASSVGTNLSHSTHQEARGPSPLAPRALEFDLNQSYVMDEQDN